MSTWEWLTTPALDASELITVLILIFACVGPAFRTIDRLEKRIIELERRLHEQGRGQC